MFQIDRAYIMVALLLAIAGMLQGLHMGIAEARQYMPLHIALLLPGFVTLAIYGMLFRLWPAMKTAPLANAQFWTAMVGIAGLIGGAFLFIFSGGIAVVAAGSVVTIIAALMMAWLFWTASEAT